MKTIDSLRPETRPLDPEWSAATLQSILSETTETTETTGTTGTPSLVAPVRSRRSFRVAAAVAAAAVVVLAVGLVGPFGPPGTSAAAAQLTAEHLSIHPEVGADEFLHIQRVERDWGYGGAGVEDPFTLKYWVPGAGGSEWVERSGSPGEVDTNKFADWGPRIYVNHSSKPSELVGQLRDYAASQDEGRDLHGLWTVAYWIANDPVAPQSFKDEVMRALSTLGGIQVADHDFAVTGLSGKALTMGGAYDVWFVVDPQTWAFRGIVGHPEKDKTWVGPEAPMWTITFRSSVAADAP